MMIKEQITLDEVIDYLNELIEIDCPAIASLIANRVPCNQKMADHPTVQVMQQHGGSHVGMLGILNGLFGTFENGWGPITFMFDSGNLVKVIKADRTIAESEVKENRLPVSV